MRQALWRTFSRLISVPWVSRVVLRLATRIDRPLMRVSRGRWRLSFIIPCVLIECRGVRSGLPHEVPLLCVADDDNLLVVGSNGGAEREPAWCANLRAYPEIRARYSGRDLRMRAVELEGAQRARAWLLATEAFPGYERYQARLSRRIPLFNLISTDSPGESGDYS